MYALVDANNFYVSCERVFRPDLRFRPTAVLSSNDGCIVARSNEVKALQIPMGAPVFQHRQLLNQHNVELLSANFTLYGDMSARMMDLMDDFSDQVEVYSIDEAFVRYPENEASCLDWGQRMRQTVKQSLGLPVSIGVAPTKTLAKVANHFAKLDPQGVVVLSSEMEQDFYLKRMDIGDVWGVGRRMAPKLERYGLRNALQLKQADLDWIRGLWGVVGVRLVMELRGIKAYRPTDVNDDRKSLIYAHTFGQNVFALQDLYDIARVYTSRLSEKLRKQQLCTQLVYVSLRNSPFQSKESYYSERLTHKLAYPTSYLPDLIEVVHGLVKQLYQKGIAYKKLGVMFLDLSKDRPGQDDFFQQTQMSDQQKSLMAVMDQIQQRWGREAIQFGSPIKNPHWKTKCSLKSPSYTTRWSDLPLVVDID